MYSFYYAVMVVDISCFKLLKSPVKIMLLTNLCISSIHRNTLRYKNFIAKYICSFSPSNSHSNEFCILSHIINENPTNPNVFKHNWYYKLSRHMELLFMALVLINFVIVLLLLLLIRTNVQYLFIYLFIIFVTAFVYLDEVILHRDRQFLLIVLFCSIKELDYQVLHAIYEDHITSGLANKLSVVQSTGWKSKWYGNYIPSVFFFSQYPHPMPSFRTFWQSLLSNWSSYCLSNLFWFILLIMAEVMTA